MSLVLLSARLIGNCDENCDPSSGVWTQRPGAWQQTPFFCLAVVAFLASFLTFLCAPLLAECVAAWSLGVHCAAIFGIALVGFLGIRPLGGAISNILTSLLWVAGVVLVNHIYLVVIDPAAARAMRRGIATAIGGPSNLSA